MDIYDPAQYYITDMLLQAYPKIRKEYQRWHWLFKKFRYSETKKLRGESGTASQLENHGAWELLPIMVKNQGLWKTKLFFPTTYALIDQVPVYDNMAFSIYHPGTEIDVHRGWSDNHIRFQLGIDCNDNSCLVVNDIHIPQRNGEVIVFNDYQLHWGYNRGDTTRVVLLFDVLKEDLEKSRKK
jgi:hypothetical protein